jgi:hypothetical protein
MDYDFYDYEDVEEGFYDFGEEEWPRDVKVDEAKEELTRFFNERAEEIFYLKQLEVFFEKRFFHWITGKAVKELIGDGLLGMEEVPLLKGSRVKFVFNKRLRYYKRQIKEHIEVIREYSNHVIAIACGQQAEVLFFSALTNRGFLSHGRNINEYGGKKWTATDHNLDFIIERDNIIYGCEVKNRWDYIGKEELDIKLEMCDFLGIKPLFIMRYSPKDYNWQIIQKGGYAMIFETQIYPFGQQNVVNRIKEVLSLPVDCPRAIPSGIIDRFMRWHNRKGRL